MVTSAAATVTQGAPNAGTTVGSVVGTGERLDNAAGLSERVRQAKAEESASSLLGRAEHEHEAASPKEPDRLLSAIDGKGRRASARKPGRFIGRSFRQRGDKNHELTHSVGSRRRLSTVIGEKSRRAGQFIADAPAIS